MAALAGVCTKYFTSNSQAAQHPLYLNSFVTLLRLACTLDLSSYAVLQIRRNWSIFAGSQKSVTQVILHEMPGHKVTSRVSRYSGQSDPCCQSIDKQRAAPLPHHQSAVGRWVHFSIFRSLFLSQRSRPERGLLVFFTSPKLKAHRTSVKGTSARRYASISWDA